MIESYENPIAREPVRIVCISGLKMYAAENLSIGSPLREILLSEKDNLSVKEFLAKMSVWLRLFDWKQGVNMQNHGPKWSTNKMRGEADERRNIR